MNKDKKTLYVTVVLFLGALLLTLFVKDELWRKLVLIAVALAASTAAMLLIKKRSIHKKEKRQMSWFLPVVAIAALSLYFSLGAFFGYVKLSLTLMHILTYVLPILTIVILSELARSIFLAQNNKVVTVLTYVAFVLVDVSMLQRGSVFTTYGRAMSFLGLVIFPALTANLLYNFISKRYGAAPVIIYKALMLCYGYVIPLKPNLPDAMLAFVRLLLPIAAFLFVEMIYEKKKFVTPRTNVYMRTAFNCIMVIAMTLIIMLISCRFDYGMLVIASESMTGTIDKGDAIVYKRYEQGEIIDEGQVLVFEKNGITEVHRVIEIQHVNGELRYYTKGDANDYADSGFITSRDIVGLTDVTIKYIGHPTLWVRQVFK